MGDSEISWTVQAKHWVPLTTSSISTIIPATDTKAKGSTMKNPAYNKLTLMVIAL